LVTKLLVIEQLLHPALKSAVSAPLHNFQLCPSSQQILAKPLQGVVHEEQMLQECKTHSAKLCQANDIRLIPPPHEECRE